MTKIIYVPLAPRPEDLPAGYFLQLEVDALSTIKHVTSSLNLSNSSGNPITVNVEVLTDFNDKSMFYNAGASLRGSGQYTIRMGAGVLLHIDNIAQLLVADASILKGSRKSEIIDAGLIGKTRKEVLKSFVFHYLTGLLFWHELAHVVLGHIDWIYMQRNELQITELWTRPFTAEIHEQQKVLEADADKHAASWLLATYDHVITRNPYLRYKSQIDGFYDFGVMVAALFRVFEALEVEIPDSSRSHPSNTVRIMTSMFGLNDFFQKYYEGNAQVFYQACCTGAGSAISLMTHPGAKPPDEVETILQTLEYGMKISTMNVRKLQFSVNVGETSVFLKKNNL